MFICDKDYVQLSAKDRNVLLNYQKKQKTLADFQSPNISDGSDLGSKEDRTLIRHAISLFPNNYVDLSLYKDSNVFLPVAKEFRTIVGEENSEDSIQDWLKKEGSYNYLITASIVWQFGSGHHGIYLFKEVPIGSSYVVDYVVIGVNSYGLTVCLVELESKDQVHGCFFTKEGRIGKLIKKGVDQIDDWQTCIRDDPTLLKKILLEKQGVFSTPIDSAPGSFIFQKKYVVVAGNTSDELIGGTPSVSKRKRNEFDQLSKRDIIVMDYHHMFSNAFDLGPFFEKDLN